MAEAGQRDAQLRSRRRARSSCASISGKDVPETDVRTALATGDMGFLHSFTTGSTVDGPGVRVVAWTTGCMWRCLYCHNPDTWTMTNGIPVTVAKAAEELRKYRHGLKVMAGGFTLSGGEPLMQHRFAVKLLTAAKAWGSTPRSTRTATTATGLTDAELEAIDLVLLDIKTWDPRAAPAAHRHGRRADAGRSRGGWPRGNGRSGCATCWCPG